MFEYERIGDVLVVCFLPGSLPNDEWARFMSVVRRQPITWLITAHIGTNEVTGLQRREGADYVMMNGIETVNIIDSRVMRGLLTAARWMGVKAHAYAWNDLRAAVERAGFVDPAKAEQAMNTILFMRRTLERKSSVATKAG